MNKHDGKYYGPTPHGVGGLKSLPFSYRAMWYKSHPARGGWIEMTLISLSLTTVSGPTPHGVGGLKFSAAVIAVDAIPVPPRTGWVD